MASKQKSIKMFSSSPSASIAPWLGIAAIIVLIDQITKITINKLFTFGESCGVFCSPATWAVSINEAG